MNADQALELVLDGTTDELDSGDETDIDEDASFPLPVDEESEQSEYEGNFLSSTNNVKKSTVSDSKDTQMLLCCVATPTSEMPVETDSGGESDAVGENEVGEESVRTRGRGRGRGRGRARARRRSTGGRGRGRQASRGRTSIVPWVITTPGNDQQPPPKPFTATKATNLHLPQDPQPIDYFSQLVDHDVLQLIADETNRCSGNTC